MRRRTLLTGAGMAGLVGLSSVRPARADAMADAKKRGSLIVGMEVAYVPYEFFKDGVIVGYDPDIIALMMPKLGVKAQLVDTAWNGIIPALYAGKFDCIVSAMTITKERAEKVLFSMPYADASNVIFLRADETIVKTVIGMAHSLGLEVVAEGVETPLQWSFLRENQCDLIQGYVLSPPLPASAFEEFYREHSHDPRPDVA